MNPLEIVGLKSELHDLYNQKERKERELEVQTKELEKTLENIIKGNFELEIYSSYFELKIIEMDISIEDINNLFVAFNGFDIKIKVDNEITDEGESYQSVTMYIVKR